MNKKFVYMVLFAVIAISSLACSVGGINVDVNLDSIKGSGKVIEEFRTLSGVTGVNLASIGSLTIVYGDKEEIAIKADDNLMSYITTEVENGVLTIGVKNAINILPLEKIEYVLTVTQPLTELKVSGLGNIFAEKIETNDFEIVVSGSGDISVKDLQAVDIEAVISGLGSISLDNGKIESQNVTISGSGSYQAKDVESETASVKVSGLGNASIWVTKKIDATISGSGDIEYYGDPQVSQEVSGLGRLLSKGDH